MLGGNILINIGAIKNISRVKKCPRGSVLTGDGLSNMMFIVLKGEVGVFLNYRLPGAEMVSTLGTGDLFADPGLLQDKRADYTTAALSDAIVLPIERHNFSEFLQDEPSLAFDMFKELYMRLEQVNTAYKEVVLHHADLQRHHEKKPEGKMTDASRNAERQPSATPYVEKTAAPSSGPIVQGPLGGADNIDKFRLFPEGHGTYELSIDNNDTAHLMNKTLTCPICKGISNYLAVKPSKLVLASTDSDMRSRYKGIEPLYYDVLTCPHCLYSALPDVFSIPDKSKSDIARELGAIKNAYVMKQGTDRDVASVFAGFYLALFCAPVSFSKYQLITGKLLYKLSRVYQDAGDEVMEKQTSQKALESYLYAYEKTGITPAQEQQICIIIGELYLKQGDLKNAIVFFSKAKLSSCSTPALKSHAENRVYDIREMAAASRQ